jgi:hypothetical protein
LCLYSSLALPFSNYSFCILHHVLLAHAMVSKRAIGFSSRIKLHALMVWYLNKTFWSPAIWPSRL